MAVISGGTVIPSGATANPGLKNVIYTTNAVPTDGTIGVTAANGMLAQNVVTGFVYERQAGAWVRIDTL
jgi:hypothetical protein